MKGVFHKLLFKLQVVLHCYLEGNLLTLKLGTYHNGSYIMSKSNSLCLKVSRRHDPTVKESTLLLLLLLLSLWLQNLDLGMCHFLKFEKY